MGDNPKGLPSVFGPRSSVLSHCSWYPPAHILWSVSPRLEAVYERRTFIHSAVAAATVISIPRRQALGAIFSARPQGTPDVDAVTGDGKQITLKGKGHRTSKPASGDECSYVVTRAMTTPRRILNPSFESFLRSSYSRPASRHPQCGELRARKHGVLLAVKFGGHARRVNRPATRACTSISHSSAMWRVEPVAKRRGGQVEAC